MIKNCINKVKRNQFGYTMLELVLAIALLGIIAGVMARMFIWGIDIYSFVSNRKDVLQTSRIGIEILVRDLRSIKSAGDINSASNGQIDFYNLDDENIIFTYNSGVFSRNSNTMIDGLSSFQFTYYDVDDDLISSPVADPATIWKIKYTLYATIDAKTFHLESTVIPRNFN